MNKHSLKRIILIMLTVVLLMVLIACSRKSGKKDDVPYSSSMNGKKEVPEAGDEIKDLNDTEIGEYDIKNVIRKPDADIKGKKVKVYLNSFFWLKDGKVIYIAECYSFDREAEENDLVIVEDHRDVPIDYPYDYRNRSDYKDGSGPDTIIDDEEPESSHESRWSHVSSYVEEDEFDAWMFEDPDDFWDYYSEDFECYEEAEDYWYRHHGDRDNE
ncbi:MAG: hypothetical protein IKI62_04510 [Clostridia bacterium]|nr:hypothetical protein [Clostridia bacterium]